MTGCRCVRVHDGGFYAEIDTKCLLISWLVGAIQDASTGAGDDASGTSWMPTALGVTLTLTQIGSRSAAYSPWFFQQSSMMVAVG